MRPCTVEASERQLVFLHRYFQQLLYEDPDCLPFRGAPYKGKKVLVVGSRSSAADACTALVDGGAEKVLMSHRGGVILVSYSDRFP